MQPVAVVQVIQGDDGEVYVSGPLDGPVGKSLCLGMLERAIRKVEAYQPKTSPLVVAAPGTALPPSNGTPTNRMRQQ